MKRKISLLLSFILVSCSSNNESSIERITNDDTFSLEEHSISELQEEDYSLIPLYFVDKLHSYDSYKASTIGSSVANIALAKVNQSIFVTTLKDNDISYTLNESYSSMVEVKHEAYFKDNKALYKNINDDDYSLVSLSDYLDIYGSYPFEYSLEGYSIDSESILSVTKIDSENYNSFKIVFDPIKSTNNIKIQMKEMGKLDEYPKFESIEITIKMEDDFSPVSIDVEASYKAKKIVNTNCLQKYTVIFSKLNEKIEIPKIDTISEYFA